MDFFSIITIIISLLLLYFFFGVLIKFFWGWLPLIIATMLSISLIIVGGTINSILAIILFFAGTALTNSWQGSDLYFMIEEKIEKLFYFKD